MTFLAPLFLIGSAAAAIPIVLHLLKREPEPRLQFSAVKLLRHAPVELTAKRRLRELLLLALRVAALVLLALAFARPFFASSVESGSSGATIVAVDVSYSLSAPGRIERARELAKAAIARAPAGDAVGVLTFGDVSDVLAPPSADRALANAAVDRIEAGFGATRYQVGLNAASQALAGRRGTIVVVTDLQESGWDSGAQVLVPSSARIEIADVGPPPPNLAVTAIHPAGDRIAVSVRNTGPRPRDARVSLVLDGRSAGEMATSIGPDATAEVVFAATTRASSAKVSVVDREGLQADNARYATLDESARPSLLVVTAAGDLDREAFYVQQALAAGAPTSGGYQIVGVGGAQLSTWDAARLAGHSAVLLLSTQGLERRGREALAAFTQNGGGLVIAAGPDIDGDVVADVLGGAPLRIAASSDDRPRPRMLAPADVRHPIFQPFGARASTLGLVKFQRLARIGGGQCQTLATFTTGEAAMLECAAGEGRAIVIASDLNNRWNDFPLHPTFVPFVHEVVRYVSSTARAGEYLVGDSPVGLSRTPGFATLKEAGPAARARRVAINVDPREGDPSRLSADEFQAAVTRLKDMSASEERLEVGRQEDRQHLWLYVFMLMLATLLLESAVASRT